MKKLSIVAMSFIALFSGCQKDDKTPNTTNTPTPAPTTATSKTLTLQPDSSKGKDAVVTSGDVNGNYKNHPEFLAMGWTVQGVPTTGRSFLSFDLSSIPAGAVITSAKLSLYCSADSVNGTDATPGSANAAFLQRVTQSWDEATVTWTNQPATTTQNQVTLAQSTSLNQDYPDIDVTALVKDMLSNQGGNFGFMLRLQNEVKYNAMEFASTDYPDNTKHPKLVVVYTVK